MDAVRSAPVKGGRSRPLSELDDAEAIAWLWPHGRRAALLGALIGVGVVLLVVVGFALLRSVVPDGDDLRFTRPEVAPLLIRAAGLIALGPVVGLMITNAQFSSRASTASGAGAEGRTIRQAVFGRRPVPLTPEERARAVRYAPLGAAAVRFGLVSAGALYLALLLQQVPTLLTSPGDSLFDLRWFSVVIVAVLVVTFVVLLPLQLRNAERATRYPQAAAAGVDRDRP